MIYVCGERLNDFLCGEWERVRERLCVCEGKMIERERGGGGGGGEKNESKEKDLRERGERLIESRP